MKEKEIEKREMRRSDEEVMSVSIERDMCVQKQEIYQYVKESRKYKTVFISQVCF